MESEWLRQKRQRDLDRVLASPDFTPEQRDVVLRLAKRWKDDGLSLKTRYLYACKARQLGTFLGMPYEDASKDDLKAFLADAGERNSPYSLQCVKGFVKLFYKALVRPDEAGHPEIVAWIQFNTRMLKTKLPQDLLSTAEVKRIAECTSHPRDKALLMVLYESAARASELVSMRVGDLEFDAYGARVTLTGKTGQRKVRLMNSVPDLQVWLDSHPKRDDVSAPLWLSWGHQNFHKPLLRDGLRRIVLNARELAGITKRVHPHLFRHSRLTELAKQLSESELKVFAGWAADSSMAKVYIHLSGDDVDRKMLEKAGLLTGEKETAPDALVSRECPRCQEKNSATSQYCSRCTMPLSEKTATEMVREQELLMKNLPKLLELVGGNSSEPHTTNL